MHVCAGCYHDKRGTNNNTDIVRRSKAGSSSASAEPVIPRRGEKDFEPASEQRYIDLQSSQLERSRAALFSAISSGTRQHSSKAHNRAIWDDKLGRAYMVDAPEPALGPATFRIIEERRQQGRAPPATAADDEGDHQVAVAGPPGGAATARPATVHGIHFQTMGRYEQSRKRLELLPEEALYLIERGTVECWTSMDDDAVPMSLQHAWSLMMTAANLTPERYQVYAYLRRLGYTVIRPESTRSTSDRHVVPSRLPQSTAFVRIYHTLVAVSDVLLYLPRTIMRTVHRLVFGPAPSALHRLSLVAKGKARSLVGGQRWFSYGACRFTDRRAARSVVSLYPL